MLKKQFSENKIGYVTFRITNTNLDLGIIRGYIYDSKYIFNDSERLSSAILLSPSLNMVTADVILEVTDLYTQKLILDMLCKIHNSIGYEFKIYCDLNINIWRFISAP